MVIPNTIGTKDKLLKLMSDKDQLEQRINNYGAVLLANANVGMNEPLIDGEGFPRNDIDVYQVRQARQQIICLQNDHKELMNQIEKLLHKLHAEAGHDESTVAIQTQNMDINSTETNTLITIARVNLVSPGSPAEDAGLRVDDEIIEFGSINSENLENNLNQIGVIVKQMQDQRIPLKIRRTNEIFNLVLIPKLWSGRGLLGCNIVLPEVIDR